jgi:hypothetical protein
MNRIYDSYQSSLISKYAYPSLWGERGTWL